MVPGNRAESKAWSIAIIAACQVAAMALWFSASAVVPALVAEFHLSAFMQAALTSAVQVGFVVGCLVSALLGLPDRVDPRRLFAASAAIGAHRQRAAAGRRSVVVAALRAARRHGRSAWRACIRSA